MTKGPMSRRGITMVELMVGTLLLVGGGGALLMGMQYAVAHSSYLNEFQIAMNAVQGKLEELSSTPFDTLLNDVSFADARRVPPAAVLGQCMGMGEDRNCNGALDLAPVNEDTNPPNGVLDEPLALQGGRLSIQIRPVPPPGGGTPTLLDIHVAACWTSRGRPIGEDRNCNGVLDPGEDANGNGWVDSPAMASTRIATRS